MHQNKEVPFSVSSKDEICISQGENKIVLSDKGALDLVEMINVLVAQRSREQIKLDEFYLPSESQIRQQSSYLFGQNRNALSDKEGE